MGIFKSISGLVSLELTSADVAQSIRRITELGIEIYDTKFISELTVTFQIRRADYQRLAAYAKKRGITIKIRSRRGIYWKLRALTRRPVLVLGIAMILFVCWTVPGRIFFVEIQGNQSVPTRLILEAAEESGICFGASRREVRSEKMKNALLSRVPELQWAGVNTYGSRAVITVRERSVEESIEKAPGVSSIVADRDGIVLSCTVTRGNGLVTPGQAVQAGQTLISGYTDCGISIEATRAEGEILAQTSRALTVKTLSQRQVRACEQEKNVNYSLIIGKKRINFFKGSGISEGSCVKMYSKYVLTLPGGFQLPVALIKETVVACDLKVSEVEEETVKTELSDFAEKYMRSQMIAGTITERFETLQKTDAYCMTGRYACQEMIGRVKPEQIGVYHGKTD